LFRGRAMPAASIPPWDDSERSEVTTLSDLDSTNMQRTEPAGAAASGLGLLHVYTGNGKGKSTAAMGLAVRAAGRGRRVTVVQFLKSRATGEVASLERLGIEVLRSTMQLGFTYEMDEEAKEASRQEQRRLLELAAAPELLARTDLLIMDEILTAVGFGFLEEQRFRDFLAARPARLELVCTGHKLPDWLLEQADYATEMRKLKHPYERGIPAREAVEY